MRRLVRQSPLVLVPLVLVASLGGPFACESSDSSEGSAAAPSTDAGATGGSGGVGANTGGAAGAGTGGAFGGGGGADPDDAGMDSSTDPAPLGPGGEWSLVFRDEFDGTEIDLDHWHPNWFGSDETSVTVPVNDAEACCYDPAQLVVQNGALELTAVTTSNPDCHKKDGSQASCASGLIMSDGLYNFTYGFAEARVFLPPGTGMPEGWSAFWINGDEWPQDGEIDVMETLGGGDSTRWTYHYDSDIGSGEVHSQVTASENNLVDASGWHVFGVDWQSDVIRFWYDGVDVGSISASDLEGGATIVDAPHYFIANLGIHESYPAELPLTMRVDYVRHWQRP